MDLRSWSFVNQCCILKRCFKCWQSICVILFQESLSAQYSFFYRLYLYFQLSYWELSFLQYFQKMTAFTAIPLFLLGKYRISGNFQRSVHTSQHSPMPDFSMRNGVLIRRIISTMSWIYTTCGINHSNRTGWREVFFQALCHLPFATKRWTFA